MDSKIFMINLKAIHFFQCNPPNRSYWFYWADNNKRSPRDRDVHTEFCKLITTLQHDNHQ